MRSDLDSKLRPRENSRVRMYLYTFSGISFILGFLEGIHKTTSSTLIIHVSIGLLFLILVPLSYKRPVPAVVSCALIQAGVWSAFIVADPEYIRWLGIKIPAILLSIVALRIAMAGKTQQSLISETTESQ